MLVGQQSLFDPSRSPRGKHTVWAYCHVPNGSTFDMTDRIESQIERYAPGFRDQVLARSVMAPARLEEYNANYVGGDINGGVQDWRQLFHEARSEAGALLDAGEGDLYLFVIDAAGRRSARNARPLRRPRSLTQPLLAAPLFEAASHSRIR